MSGVRAWVAANRRTVIAVGVWAVVLAAVWVIAQLNGVTFGSLMDNLVTLLRGTTTGIVVYLVVFTLRPITLVPSWTFSVAGGALWGMWPGYAYVMVGAILSGAIPYHVGRIFKGQPPSNPAATGVFQRIVRRAHADPFQAVLLTRLLQLPYDFVNIALGGMGIPAGPYYAATVVGNLIGSLPYVLLGASLEGSSLAEGRFEVDLGVVLLSAGAMGFSLLLSWWLRRAQSRQRREKEESPSHD